MRKKKPTAPAPSPNPTLTRPFVSWYTEGVHIIDHSRRASCEVAKFIDGPQADGKTWLMNLYTAPECRKQGKATRLIEAAKNYCQKRGVRALYLVCEKDMIPFCEKRGFESIHWTRVVSGKPTYVLVCPIKDKQPKSNLE